MTAPGYADINMGMPMAPRRFGALMPPTALTGSVAGGRPGFRMPMRQPQIGGDQPPPVTPGGAMPLGPAGQPAQYGAITPANNLVGTSILPSPSADTSAARGDVSAGLAGLQTAPDRAKLAGETFQELSAQSEPDYQAALRAATQAGAGAGQLGSGMLTERLTSDPYGSSGLGLERQKYLGNLAKELSTESAGMTLQDRLNKLSAGQGVLGQLSGLDQQALQNLTGERGYEHGLSSEAFNENMAQNELLASLGGFGSVTPSTLYSQGGDLAGQGGDLLRLLLQNQQKAPSYNYGWAADLPSTGPDAVV